MSDKTQKHVSADNPGQELNKEINFNLPRDVPLVLSNCTINGDIQFNAARRGAVCPVGIYFWIMTSGQYIIPYVLWQHTLQQYRNGCCQECKYSETQYSKLTVKASKVSLSLPNIQTIDATVRSEAHTSELQS